MHHPWSQSHNQYNAPCSFSALRDPKCPPLGVTMMLLVSKREFKDCPGFLNSTRRLGPKRGRKCYVTPAFSGIPKQRGTKSEVKTSARGHHVAPRGTLQITDSPDYQLFVHASHVHASHRHRLIGHLIAPFFGAQRDQALRGSLKRSVRAVQLFGRLAVLETHTLRY